MRRISADLPQETCLPQEVRQVLAQFFPGFDLDQVCVYDGIPWYIVGKPIGYADRHKIYLAPEAYRIDTIEGLALIAHEITHCRQYSEHGAWLFRARYLKEYFKNRLRGMTRRDAYFYNSFEIEAREMEEMVFQALFTAEARGCRLTEIIVE
jgi:hypothetical protein